MVINNKTELYMEKHESHLRIDAKGRASFDKAAHNGTYNGANLVESLPVLYL